MKSHNKEREDEILDKLLSPNSTNFIEELFKSSDIQLLLTPRILKEFLVLPINESEPKEEQIIFTDHLTKLIPQFLYTILTSDNLVNVLAIMDVGNAHKIIKHLPVDTYKGINPESVMGYIQALPLLTKLTPPISNSLDNIEKYDSSVQNLLKKTYCGLPPDLWELDSFVNTINLVAEHPVLRIVLDHITTTDGILIGHNLPLSGGYIEEANIIILNSSRPHVSHVVSTLLHEGVHALLSQRFNNESEPYSIDDKGAFDNILHTIYREYISFTEKKDKDKNFIPFVPSAELGKQQVYATGILIRDNDERASEVFPHFIQEIFDAEILHGKCNISHDLAKLLWGYFTTKICQIKQITELPKNLYNEQLSIGEIPDAKLEVFLQLLLDNSLNVALLSSPYYNSVVDILPYDIKTDYYKQVWNTLDGKTIVQVMNATVWDTFMNMSSTLSSEKFKTLLTEGNMVQYMNDIKSLWGIQRFIDKVFTMLEPQTLQDIFDLQVMDGVDSVVKNYIQSKLDQYTHQVPSNTESSLQEHAYLTVKSTQFDSLESKVEMTGELYHQQDEL